MADINPKTFIGFGHFPFESGYTRNSFDAQGHDKEVYLLQALFFLFLPKHITEAIHMSKQNVVFFSFINYISQNTTSAL